MTITCYILSLLLLAVFVARVHFFGGYDKYILRRLKTSKRVTAPISTEEVDTLQDIRALEDVFIPENLPPKCSRYFHDANFPIDLASVAKLHLGDFESSRLFGKEEIIKPACPSGAKEETRHAVVFLLHRGKLYTHNTTPMDRLSFPHRVNTLVEVIDQLLQEFGNLPSLLFKFWSVDNPVAAVCESHEADNVFGTFGYSSCPAPYCASSVVLPVDSALPEAPGIGRLHLEGSAQKFARCSSADFDSRSATAEWHGSYTGHMPMPFWDAPSAMTVGDNRSLMQFPNTNYTMREFFVQMLQGSSKVKVDFQKVNQDEMCKYMKSNRLLYSIGGGSYASNFFDNMLSGAVVIKQDYPAWGFVEPFFEPNKHYLLARRDLQDVSELTKKVLEPSSEDDYDELKKTALNGRKRALLLGRESPLMNTCFIWYLFARYASMLLPNATIFDPNEWTEFDPRSMKLTKSRTNKETITKRIKMTPRLEFIHITKTGGSAVEASAALHGIPWGACHYRELRWCKLSDWEDPSSIKVPPVKSMTYKGVPWHAPQQWHVPNPMKGTDTFLVVRNPYERIVSEYYCRWFGYRGSEDRESPRVFNQWLAGNLTLVEGNQLRDHMLPMHYYAFDEQDNQIVTHILRYENIQQEFDSLMQNYGLPIRMMKKSSKTVFHYAHGGKRDDASSSSGNQITVTDISLENLERINRIYDRDFRLFQYSKITSRNSSPA